MSKGIVVQVVKTDGAEFWYSVDGFAISADKKNFKLNIGGKKFAFDNWTEMNVWQGGERILELSSRDQ